METKIIIRVLLAFIFFVFNSCNTSQKPEISILTGKVNINWSNTINLRNGTISLAEDWANKTDHRDSIISINDDGTFKVNLNIHKPDFYTFSHEQNKLELFISPGDSLNIDISKEVIFSGNNASLNKNLKALSDIINNDEHYISQNTKEIFTNSLPQFNLKIDSLKSSYINHYNEFKKENKTPTIYDQRVISEIKYRSKTYKLVYPRLYNLFTNKTAPVNDSYYIDIVKGSFENPELLKSKNYALFLDTYIDIESSGKHKFINYEYFPIQQIQPRFNVIQTLQVHPDIKDYLFNEHLVKSIDNYGITYLEDLMQKFKQDCSTPSFVKKIEKQHKEYIELRKEPNEIRIFKKIGDIELEAHIFFPENFKEEDNRSVYAFFHGGGWALGMPEWGYKNCKQYASKGMVAISFEYRLIDIHETNIVDCVKDAKSAILWIRKQAESLGINPGKIVAAGFSAGGHLAACTAILDDYEDKDNSGFSAKPNAIIVHSATYNILKSDWLQEHSGEQPESVSSFHQLKGNLVPSILFHGTEDHLTNISEFIEFKDKMELLNNDFEYEIFEGVGHFFNNPYARKKVDKMTEDFLVKLGYINN